MIFSLGYSFSIFCWEIVGLVSWRLINHFCNRGQSFNVAKFAVFVNGVGDVLVFLLKKTIDFVDISTTSGYTLFLFSTVFLIYFCKSVLLLTQIWLPEAMERLTPVFSLLHSCTLVMAGLHFNHFAPILEVSSLNCTIIASLFWIHFGNIIWNRDKTVSGRLYNPNVFVFMNLSPLWTWFFLIWCYNDTRCL